MSNDNRNNDRTDGRGGTSDLARRNLDLAGFRITNLGEPKKEDDATKVDLKSTPRANAGSGSPGTSFLAAAADHVHPGSLGGGSGPGAAFTFNDLTMQSVTGSSLIAQYAVDLSELPGDRLAASLAALVQVEPGTAGRIDLKVGGDPGQPDGQVITSISASPDRELMRNRGELANPKKLTLIKIVAESSGPGRLAIEAKTTAVRSL